jgi:DNA/RNA-binding domain of Phe-tRNA-synthetase-like protein
MKHFSYSDALAERFPDLHSLVIFVDGLTADIDVGAAVVHHTAQARAGLDMHGSESQMASVQAWRKAYRTIGTDPTKFRMAAESLLRRLRLAGDLPDRLHPLVLICNALSARFAVPVAALDVDRIGGKLQVAIANGDEDYQAFDGTISKLPAGEVTFKDDTGQAHARKWSHKQSARSVVSTATTCAFIVAEGLHERAADDMAMLGAALMEELRRYWPGARIRSYHLSGRELISGCDATCTAQAE